MAKKQKMFARMLIVYCLVLLVSSLFVERYITDAVRESHISTLRGNLAVQALIAAEGLDLRHGPHLDNLSNFLKEKTGARVTVIAPDGNVLYDSDVQHESMDDHSGRPEIMQAGLDGTGSAIRHSSTVGYDLLYTAVRIGPRDSPEGYIRLAVPLHEINDSINRLRWKLAIAVGVLFFIVVGVVSAYNWRLKVLVDQVSEFSDSLARGELDRRLLIEGSGEFDTIAGNLNAMAQELSTMISQNEEEKERMGVILRSVPDALLILGPDNTIVMASAASREFFGAANPLQGRAVSEIIRSPEFFELLDNVRLDGKPGDVELELERPVPRYSVIKVSPVMQKGQEMFGLIVLFHDITEMKRIEEVRKDFVANVSHELKTPIAAIKGFADTLIEGALSEPDNARRFVEIIKSNSERINTLVDDLMTISKIELGVIRVEKAPVDLKECMEHAATLLMEKAQQKGLSIGLDIPSDVPRIEADRNRLIQILTNLVDNAVKFTEKGNITVGLGEEGGDFFMFVRDTGTGIPAKHIPRIGERFYRVDPSRSREMGGTGLGLAIVKHLVKAHGWEMRVESQERKGTTVKIFLS